MKREVICPFCGHSAYLEEAVCPRCSKALMLAQNDYQSVAFESSNDGYHSWYAHPTAYHMIYRCHNYPGKCPQCAHREDTLCMKGRIDIRVARKECMGTLSYGWDKGTEKYWEDETSAT